MHEPVALHKAINSELPYAGGFPYSAQKGKRGCVEGLIGLYRMRPSTYTAVPLRAVICGEAISFT